jgi:hypothetical protein
LTYLYEKHVGPFGYSLSHPEMYPVHAWAVYVDLTHWSENLDLACKWISNFNSFTVYGIVSILVICSFWQNILLLALARAGLARHRWAHIWMHISQ